MLLAIVAFISHVLVLSETEPDDLLTPREYDELKRELDRIISDLITNHFQAVEGLMRRISPNRETQNHRTKRSLIFGALRDLDQMLHRADKTAALVGPDTCTDAARRWLQHVNKSIQLMLEPAQPAEEPRILDQ